MCRICAAHAPDALRTKPASTSRSSPVRSLRTRAPVTAPSDAMQVGDAVVRQHPRAVRGRAAGERADRLPRVDARVRHRERAADAGVQPRLAAQRLGDVDLLGRQAGRAAARHEPIAVGRVVVRRGDEQAAGVLDRMRDDPAQDRVLGDALLGRHRILDHVAAAGVQQPVEAAARSLAEVAALDQHDVEAAQRGVPGHPGAGGAAADDEDVGLEASARCPCYSAACPRAEAVETPPPRRHAQSSASNQSKVRVTAFFQNV